MNKTILFIILVLSIIITILGTKILFSYLGISFKSNNESVLRRAALVVASNNERETIFIK